MSEMGLLGAISFSLVLVSLTQIPTLAEGCRILSASATGPSSVLVKWEAYPGATMYFLDFRVVNDPDSIPVVVTLSPNLLMKDVQGLKPGLNYVVTLKVFQFYTAVCVTTATVWTVPDTSQIELGQAQSSTSIFVKWTQVPLTQRYDLLVSAQPNGPTLNLTYPSTSLSAVVENLQPTTNYDCYIYTANAGGVGQKSKVKTITTLVPPPVNISATQTAANTALVTWTPVKDVLLYGVSVQSLDEPTRKPLLLNTTEPKATVQGIFPCSTYLISVSSFSKFLQPSEPRVYTYTTIKLTPVSFLSVDYSCTTNAALVSWLPVFGADSYNATATSPSGAQLTCTSQGTSCQISGVSCGLVYVVTVIPVSGNCRNTLNTTSATFQTVPCAPKIHKLVHNCPSDVIVFGWEPTPNTYYYQATAMDSTGNVQDCVTVDNTCNFTRTVCGKHYYFNVYAVTGVCQSEVSATVDIRTAPCIPQNLQTSSDCRTNVLLTTWDLAEGAVWYSVEAYGTRATNSFYNCSTMTNSCALQDIQCGEYLTVYVQAFDDECQSPTALAPVAQTAPCTPQNVAAVKDCSPYAITVTWDLSNGAIFYMVMARGSSGAVNSCNSMDLTCKVTGLQCGTNYTVTVIASNFICNSSESKSITTATAACPPSHVAASLNCDTNEAMISWLGSPRLNSYTATIVDENLGLLSCSSTTTSCSIPNLTCGRLYTATVCYHDGSCPCLPSTAISFDSVPCGPANVQARVDCASGGLTLGWNASKNAEGYMTVITNSNTTRSYNSSQPTLSVNTLPCGLVYTVRVRSFNHTCLSFASVLPVTETPCVPSNVMVKRNCSQSFMELTWQASSGAKNYTAVAVGRDNVRHTCVSNTTWCRVDGLSCSQVYDVSVAAVDDACTSAGSPAVKQPTVPCPPLQLNVSLDCSTNAAALTWSSSANALSYAGRAVSADGHSVTCDAGAALGCRLQGLLCDRDYNFTVSASDGSCHSPDSQPVIQSTAPCPLQNVTNTLDCTSNALTVSWAPRSRPVNYSARAVSRGGTEVLCSTQGSSCTLPSLKCGDQYNVTVKATSSTCEGPSSVATVVYSVPCVPVNVQGVVDCSNNTLQSSWDAAAGAVSYMSTLRGPGNSSISCVTTDLRCLFPVLQCAQTYTLSVAALGSTCNSSNSNVVSARAAPCDPKNVNAVLNCVSGVATVSWGASAGAQYYTVLARSNGLVDSCSSTGTWCQLSQLQCGEDYTVTVLAGDGRCNSSILAKTNVTTAPCAPVIQSYNLDCSSNRAVVTWVQDKDAISVSVGAASSLGYSTSCNSSNSSCVLADLQCGNTYTVQAAAQGLQCLSKPSSTFTIITAPCTPAHVEFTYSCVSGIAVLTWDETLGRKSFYAIVQSGNNTAVCMTDQTDCSLPSLLCGRTYAVKVFAVADQCNSSVPGVTQIQTGPCAPVNVSTSLVCDNNTAAVSWQPSGAAAYYQVRALGRNGDVKQCNTSTTNCLLPNMVCSETYVITVSPYSATCKGIDSYPYNYVTGSCPPTNVQVSLRCDNNVAHVNWTAALKADLYVVTAVDLRTHNCTSSQTACDLIDLSCGVTSVVTVVTVERGCRSQPSLPVTFQSVICPPANVYGVTNCMNSEITVLWDPSPRSDVTYLLYSNQYRGANAYTYTTQQTSYVFTGLLCSNLYIFKVAARDSSCTSVLSDPTQIETAPCPPTNLTASTDCGTSMGTLSWVPSLYATSYTATATGNRNNHRASCSSNTTACSMKLVCGDQYSAVVVASSETCNSSTGANLTFNSAPCLPDKVTAQVNCTANSFAVQWRPGLGNPVSYTAIAIANNDTQSTCDSTGTSCTISSLKCGLTYGLVVTTSSVSCGTIEGSDYKVQSAPCKPNNVSVDLQCSTNVALVTWANSGPDQTQVATAVDSRGGSTSCTSNSSSCTFNSLTCGESYVVSVAGHTNSCSSELAAAQGFNTAPCSPNHLTATVDCATGITTVIWDAARGATSYTVYARGKLGSNAECNTTDTNCNFQNLACGQLYSISVVARHNSCISLVSGTFDVITGPCPQSNLNTTLDCSTNTATVFWRTGRGILYYNASAEALSAPSHSCSTSGSSCNITSLGCGQSYKVSVSGQGQNCPSPGQEWNMINTAPCPPINVTVISSCISNTIAVSWQASQGSASYVAVAENAQGQQWSCTTNSTSCQISGLLCGQEYQVYVTGVDKQCNGARSQTKVIHTAPCVPYNIQNSLDCLSGVLNVTWQSTGYFLQFRTSVVSSKGQVSICMTDKHHCFIPNLLCGLAYSVTVVAQDSTCNSSQSPVQQLYTAPCPPSSFLTTLNCSTGAVSVTWNGSEPGALYVVTAVDTAGHQDNCTTTGDGCGLSTLQCGNEYNVSVTPFRNGCVGRTSPTTLIKTVPCIPKLSDVEIDCLTNSVWVFYEPSAGAVDYVAIVMDTSGLTHSLQCISTTSGICSLPEQTCSQNLTFKLEAQNPQCSSAPSNAVTRETAPCPPQNVTNTVDCDQHTVRVSWGAVRGAVMYTATLERISGGSTCCSSAATGCDITNLPCGEMHVLLVTAEGRTCNSSQSDAHIVRTTPCIPQDLKSNLSCSNNVASMSWNQSKGGQLYRVKAVSTDGHQDQCVSYDSQCELTGLYCGLHYTAQVTAEDIDCVSQPSDNITIKTVPCTPASVLPVVNCNSKSLTVSWSQSLGADSYLATVQDSIGDTTTCQGTTQGSCNVTGLGCGQVYHISVVSSDGYCNSPSTPVVDIPSVPCEPRNIKAVFDCNMKLAIVTWYPSDGAVWYVVTLSTTLGPNVTCETNSTYCEVNRLLCGHGYSVSVRAVGPSCSSILYLKGNLVTGPCVPVHITTQYSPSIGQVEWDVASGATNYTVKAMTDQGLTSTCATNDTYCALYNLVCSQLYSVTVTANNNACQGVDTSNKTVIITTEPCPPSNVETSVQCQTQTATVSWEPSVGAVSYKASLTGRNGQALSCSTNDTFCNVEGLNCGIVYYTSVIAVGNTLSSIASTLVSLVSAPCAAANVAAKLNCNNSTAEISWSAASGAVSYLVTAAAADGNTASCETVGLHCELVDLLCGQTYNVTLTSIDEHCQTEKQANVSFRTPPCTPLHVGVDLKCGTSTASLYWEEMQGVELYLATASSSLGMTLRCNSTNSTCQFSSLHCGETYVFSVTAFSSMCYSNSSSAVTIQTEPCQPTGLTVHGSCYNQTVVLVWSVAKGALVYEVTATGNLGYVASFQTNKTTVQPELLCGQLFTFTVKAQDDKCESALSAPSTFKTGPCIPENVQSFTRCENSLGSVSWASSNGAESYLAIAKGLDSHFHVCTTNTTSCTWNDLHCGEIYTVHVVANDQLCSSLPSNSTSIRMAPCIPQNLTSSMNCSIKVATLTWSASSTATLYLVTAVNTNKSHTVQLSTNDTWTFISEFQCGQHYFLSVQAVDSVCTSLPSPSLQQTSVPCPPTGVSSSMNCASNIALVSWNGSAGALFYNASLTQGVAQSQGCWSDSQQCGLPNVNCGQNFTVTVTAFNGQCYSDPSKTNTLTSVPCVPVNVNVVMDCSANQALVSWNVSGGALSYQVTAQSTQGAVSFCETRDIKCTLTNLTCGQSYSVQVVAQDNVCSSWPSPAITFSSVPCKPNISSGTLDCFTNSALVNWTHAQGALYYTSTARSLSGFVSTCNSTFTNCELRNLQCGQTYNVIVVASNENCNSPPSSRIQVVSVPCPPQNVVSVLDCSTNRAQVVWHASRGADSYIVQAFGEEEHESVCNTSTQTCDLTDLRCGFKYNISVLAINSMCNISESDIKQLKTVPCVPQQLEASVNCESGAVAVSWEPSAGSLVYTTVAQGSGGYAATCNSSDTTCVFNNLLCSLTYSISVHGSDETCASAESPAVTISTLPCVPQKVGAQMICINNTGVVSWEQEDGVSSFAVQGFGPDSHMVGCTTTGTSCQLPSLHCGELYNITVTAQDGRCDSSHVDLTLQSVPCSPTNVKASLRCQSNSAAVTWEQASGALSYYAVGVTADPSHQRVCNNTLTFCDLSDLQCGQTYNVGVFAQDESCSSVQSNMAYVKTAPCAPQNVAAVSHCAEGAISVSWSPSPAAQYFHVAAVSNTGARPQCNSTSTTCTISNLPCGQSYNITVLAVREGCESKLSDVVQTSTAPCVLKNATGRLDCISNSVWVTWDDSEGALSYFVFAQGPKGDNSSCSTSSTTCKVPDLKCGTRYSFHVTAINNVCNSNGSSSFELETGACALGAVSAVTQCGSDTILVQWQHAADATLYVVTAEGQDQTFISCNSSSNSCQLQGVRCGMQYSIIVSSSSNKCSSLRSPPTNIKTAPCVPADMTVTQLCEVNGAAARWSGSFVATSYLLTATGRDGHVASCNVSDNNCTLTNLHCGQVYAINLTASGDNCTSKPSTSSISTVPCTPSGLTVDTNCYTNSASLSWNAVEGAVQYYGQGQSIDGNVLYCNNSVSSCTFKGLKCGDVFNFSVQASNGICNTSSSPLLTVGAVPCPPASVQVRLQKMERAYWTRTTWDSVNCSDVEYLVEITGQIKNNTQTQLQVSSYWLPRRYFEIPLPCSTAFSLTVRSRNPAGAGKPSSAVTGITAPCPPENVKYSGSAQSAVLSWNGSVFATSYTVYNVSGPKRTVLCNTTALSCQLTNFNASATEITASNAVGESNANQNITGPVGARTRRDLWDTEVRAHINEDLNTPEVLIVTVSGVDMYVKWVTVKNATEYVLVIEEEEEEEEEEQSNQQPTVKTVLGDNYKESNLRPWTTYCIRLAAKNATDQSSYSRPVCRKTGASL